MRVEGSNSSCKRWQRSWTDQLLYEAGVNNGMIPNDPAAMLDRTQGWGSRGDRLANKNGAHMVHEYGMPEATIETTWDWMFGANKLPTGHAYGALVLLYPLGSPAVRRVGHGVDDRVDRVVLECMLEQRLRRVLRAQRAPETGIATAAGNVGRRRLLRLEC